MKSYNQEKVWKKWGLTPAEYKKIKEDLKREPNEVELGMYSVMWSEHCSYKSSLKHIQKFFSRENLLNKMGDENDAHSLTFQFTHHLKELRGFMGIQAGGRFVQDQNLGR